MSACDDDLPESLEAPVRNRFYRGKEMGVAQFQREQVYQRGLRALVHRLTIGSGVLCGLEVTVGPSGSIDVAAGVAIDGKGREIVVPTAQSLTVPSDQPAGDVLELWLCYVECCILPRRAPCGDPCHPASRVEHDAIREGFRLELRPKAPPPPVAVAGAGPCAPPQETCLKLATVTVTAASPTLSDTPPMSQMGRLLQRITELETKVAALEAQPPPPPPPPPPAPPGPQ